VVDQQLARFQDRLDAALIARPRGEPRSTSPWPGAGFRRAVVRRMAVDRPEIVVVEHHTQYLPRLRRALPAATVVLVMNQALFSQSKRSWLERRLACADVIGGASQYIADQIATRFPEFANRCVVVGDGVDADEFTDVPARTSMRSPVRRIVYLGAVSPHKGVHVLLAAAEGLLDDEPDVIVDIYGAPSEYPLREMVDQNDVVTAQKLRPWYGDYAGRLAAMVPQRLRERIRFHGSYSRASLAELLVGSTVAAFPTVSIEAFGMPPVEAMAAGVPVVVTDSGGMAETVLDGRTGLVVPRDDPVKLRTALVRLLRDEELRTRLAAAGQADVRANKTWRNVADRVLAGAVAARANKSRPHPDPPH
jgi:glycosyltransferase involved in cell wall biosynthesis